MKTPFSSSPLFLTWVVLLSTLAAGGATTLTVANTNNNFAGSPRQAIRDATFGDTTVTRQNK